MNDSNSSNQSALERKSESAKRLAVYVRLTRGEHEQIMTDAKTSGRSLQDLLKLAYFSKNRVVLLMNTEEQDRWFKELRYWGNNLNQIAKRLNAGIMSGWYDEFKLVATAIARIQQKAVGVHGHS